jgi:hypothetical protein
MSAQTLMPVFNWKQEAETISSFQFPAPSITDEVDLLRGSDNPVRWEALTVQRPLKVVPRTLPKIREEIPEVTLLEKWEGFVSEILSDGFSAKFKRNASDFEDVLAEFDFSELADDDRKILSEGMPLIWSITRERRNGTVKRSSELILRRQPRQLKSNHENFAGRLNEWINSAESTGC